LENGWKQFDIETGEQLVTITVKPKMFKRLEQAQKTIRCGSLLGRWEKTEQGFFNTT